jgi:hypothetical protein
MPGCRPPSLTADRPRSRRRASGARAELPSAASDLAKRRVRAVETADPFDSMNRYFSIGAHVTHHRSNFLGVVWWTCISCYSILNNKCIGIRSISMSTKLVLISIYLSVSIYIPVAG